jgi:phosphocarrier protein HPr
MTIRLKLNNVTDASLFVTKCGNYREDIDYVCGRYILDAKSLMGVLSVGFDRVCEVKIHTCDENVVQKLKNDLELWGVEG